MYKPIVLGRILAREQCKIPALFTQMCKAGCYSMSLRLSKAVQAMGGIGTQQIAAMAQQQQLQNLTQQLQSQLSLQNMNLNFFNQVIPSAVAANALHIIRSTLQPSFSRCCCRALLAQKDFPPKS